MSNENDHRHQPRGSDSNGHRQPGTGRERDGEQNQEGYVWKFRYGSVFVQLTGLADEDTFTVWSSVLKLPANDEVRLMRHLLEMNWSGTFEACFGIFNDQVVVLSTRTLAELSPGEISASLP